MAWAVTVDFQRAPHGAGGIRAIVQTKTMPIFPRGETKTEYARQIVRLNANAIVNHGDLDRPILIANTHRHLFIQTG